MFAYGDPLLIIVNDEAELSNLSFVSTPTLELDSTCELSSFDDKAVLLFSSPET